MSMGAGVLLSTSCPKCLLMYKQCRAGSSCFIYNKQWYPLLHSYKKNLYDVQNVMSYWLILKQMHPGTTSSYCALFLSFQEVWTRNHKAKKIQMHELGYSQFKSVGLWEVTLQASERTSATSESCLTGTLMTWVSGMSTNTRLSRPSGGAVTCNLIKPSSFC